MIDKNIIIAALARDCENSLRDNIPVIEDFRAQVSWSQVVVVENDSKDRTKELLQQWKETCPNVTIITNDFGTKTIPDKSESIANPMTSYQRIDKMVAYRNIYLDYIESINHAIDIVIVIDIDVMHISTAGLIDVINNFDEKTGAVFSNGISVMPSPVGVSEIYYDTFAVWEYPLVKEYGHSPESLARTFKSINKNVVKTPYYKVISAFGGVGVYNYHAIKDLRYQRVLNPLNQKEAICEHIPFHHDIVKRGYENFIARDFKVIYEKHNWTLILKLVLPRKLFNLIYPLILKLK